MLKNKILNFDNRKTSYQQFPLSRLLKEIGRSRIDIAAFLGKIPEREKTIDFSKESIYSTDSYLMVLTNSKLKTIKSTADLKNEIIGIVQNTAICDFIKMNKKSLITEETANENFVPILVNKLMHKRITAAYAYLPESLYYEAKMMGIHKYIRMVKIPNNRVFVYVGFSKKINQNIRKKIEENIKKFHLEQIAME